MLLSFCYIVKIIFIFLSLHNYIYIYVIIIGQKSISYYPRCFSFNLAHTATTSTTTNPSSSSSVVVVLKIYNHTKHHLIHYKVKPTFLSKSLFVIDRWDGTISYHNPHNENNNYDSSTSNNNHDDNNKNYNYELINIKLSNFQYLDNLQYGSYINTKYDELSCYISIDLYVTMYINDSDDDNQNGGCDADGSMNNGRHENVDHNDEININTNSDNIRKKESQPHQQLMLLETINIPIVIRNLSFLYKK